MLQNASAKIELDLVVMQIYFQILISIFVGKEINGDQLFFVFFLIRSVVVWFPVFADALSCGRILKLFSSVVLRFPVARYPALKLISSSCANQSSD